MGAFRIDDSKPHPYERHDALGIVRRIYERREAVLRALVEHCGGIDAARARIMWTDHARWDPASPLPLFSDPLGDVFAETMNEAIALDGVTVWIGGYGAKLRWRERFTPECPADVVDAVPAEIAG